MVVKGDFLSFKFDGHDISEFGAVRTSGGDRYNDNLQPEIKDITAEVPGMHGQYYFGSIFGNKIITVSFAFDSMTEEQLRKMRRVFACGQISDLILSECPYKKYLAKIESPIELSYICFDEPMKRVQQPRDGVRKINDREYHRIIIDPTTEEEVDEVYYARGPELVTPYEYVYEDGQIKYHRVYKGEGTINFICYFPFAKSVYKTLPIVTTAETDPYSINYDPYVANIDEWKESSGLLTETAYNNANIDSQIPYLEEANATCIPIYNPGDIATGFRLYCPFGVYNNEFSIIYFINKNIMGGTEDWQEQARLTFNPITKIKDNEDGFFGKCNRSFNCNYKWK